MTKNELLKKVKFMEEAIEKGERFDLLGIPTYGNEKKFVGLEYHLGNCGFVELLSDKNVYVILKAESLENKKSDLRYTEINYCKCKMFDFENECKCNIPSKQELENEWYENLLQNIKSRVESIIKDIK